jgi:hypothetical protein
MKTPVIITTLIFALISAHSRPSPAQVRVQAFIDGYSTHVDEADLYAVPTALRNAALDLAQ